MRMTALVTRVFGIREISGSYVCVNWLIHKTGANTRARNSTKERRGDRLMAIWRSFKPSERLSRKFDAKMISRITRKRELLTRQKFSLREIQPPNREKGQKPAADGSCSLASRMLRPARCIVAQTLMVLIVWLKKRILIYDPVSSAFFFLKYQRESES